MTQELLYTSAPKGLKPGSRGFCTVVSTQGLPAPLVTALEGLSAYRPVYPHGDSRAADNPVNWSHMLLSAGGRPLHVLSRVAEYGLDYSQRSNKLAHHVVLSDAECVAAGPAWVLQQPGVLQAAWDGAVRTLPQGRAIPRGRSGSLRAAAWERATGDAGWAGVVAEALQADPNRQVFFIFSPGMDLLPLVSEVLALLPETLRWKITFSTYCTQLPPNATCQWRCHLADSPEAQQSQRFVKGLRIDLTKPLGEANGAGLVAAARTGEPTFAVSVPVIPTSTDEVVDLEFAAVPSAWNSPPPQSAIGGPQPSYRLQSSAGPRPVRMPGLPPELPVQRKRSWGLITLLSTVAVVFLAAVGGGVYLARNAVIAAAEQVARASHEVTQQADKASLEELDALELALNQSLASRLASRTPESNAALAFLEEQRTALLKTAKDLQDAAELLGAAKKAIDDKKYSEAISGLQKYLQSPIITPEQREEASSLLTSATSEASSLAKADQPTLPTFAPESVQDAAMPGPPPPVSQPTTATAPPQAVTSPVPTTPPPTELQAPVQVTFRKDPLPSPDNAEFIVCSSKANRFALLYPELLTPNQSQRTIDSDEVALVWGSNSKTRPAPITMRSTNRGDRYELVMPAKHLHRNELSWCGVLRQEEATVEVLRDRFKYTPRLPVDVVVFDRWADRQSANGIPKLYYDRSCEISVGDRRLCFNLSPPGAIEEKPNEIGTLADPAEAAALFDVPPFTGKTAPRITLQMTTNGFQIRLVPSPDETATALGAVVAKEYKDTVNDLCRPTVFQAFRDLPPSVKRLQKESGSVDAIEAAAKVMSTQRATAIVSASPDQKAVLQMEKGQFDATVTSAGRIKQHIQTYISRLEQIGEFRAALSTASVVRLRIYYRLVGTPDGMPPVEVDVVRVPEYEVPGSAPSPPADAVKAERR